MPWLRPLQGFDGGGGGAALSTIEVAFTFATPSPLMITPLVSTERVMRAEVVIDTTFDGVGAGLQLGTAATPGAILSTAEIDVTVADTYRSFDRFEVGAAANVELEITPGAGATQGAGRVFLEVWS